MTSRAPVDMEPGRSVGRSWLRATWLARAIGRRSLLLWPVFAAVAIAGVGFVVDGAVEREVRHSAERHVADVLEAHTSAVVFWYDRRLDAVAGLASSSEVRGPATVLLGPAQEGERGRALIDYRESVHSLTATSRLPVDGSRDTPPEPPLPPS